MSCDTSPSRRRTRSHRPGVARARRQGPPSAAQNGGTEELHGKEASRTSPTRPQPAPTGTRRVHGHATRRSKKHTRAPRCSPLQPLPQTIREKIIRQILTEGRSAKFSPGAFKTAKVIENQGCWGAVRVKRSLGGGDN